MVNSLVEFDEAHIIFSVFEIYLPHSKHYWWQVSVLFQEYFVVDISCPTWFCEIILKGLFLIVDANPSDKD